MPVSAGLQLPGVCVGNEGADAERLPVTLADAAVLFEDSALVREAFGEDVVAQLPPEQRACGAGGVQRGGHRLGEDTWI